MDSRHPRALARRGDRGFTLAEVLLVTVIVGVGIAAVSWLMTMAAMTQEVHAQADPEALMLAREIRELVSTLPTTPAGLGVATSGDEIVALDSLDGATFSPPIRADRKAMSGMDGWAQQIDVCLCDLDDPDVVLDESVCAVAQGERAVFRLAVTISKSGTLVDTYTWWIVP